MKRRLRTLLSRCLSASLPDSNRLRSWAYQPKFRTWCGEQTHEHPTFAERTDMYDYVNREVLQNGPIQYLEFGVFQGESIRYFSQINTHPDSRFVGFDTFEGLPEMWEEYSRKVEKGTFSTNGAAPQIDDPRVSFEKGLFQETLPGFVAQYEPKGRLVIHNDSDLYSAT